jgi:hypothetical protein
MPRDVREACSALSVPLAIPLSRMAASAIALAAWEIVATTTQICGERVLTRYRSNAPWSRDVANPVDTAPLPALDAPLRCAARTGSASARNSSRPTFPEAAVEAVLCVRVFPAAAYALVVRA